MSASTVKNMAKRGSVSCQHVLGMLRWLGQPPECFVPHETDLPKAPLPKAGANRRLRWDIWAMADLLDAERRSRGLTWNQLALELGCSSNQISGPSTPSLWNQYPACNENREVAQAPRRGLYCGSRVVSFQLYNTEVRSIAMDVANVGVLKLAECESLCF